MVAALGFSVAIFGHAIFAITPVPLWIRALLFALFITLGAYYASYALFHHLNTRP